MVVYTRKRDLDPAAGGYHAPGRVFSFAAGFLCGNFGRHHYLAARRARRQPAKRPEYRRIVGFLRATGFDRCNGRYTAERVCSIRVRDPNANVGDEYARLSLAWG